MNDGGVCRPAPGFARVKIAFWHWCHNVMVLKNTPMSQCLDWFLSLWTCVVSISVVNEGCHDWFLSWLGRVVRYVSQLSKMQLSKLKANEVAIRNIAYRCTCRGECLQFPSLQTSTQRGHRPPCIPPCLPARIQNFYNKKTTQTKIQNIQNKNLVDKL